MLGTGVIGPRKWNENCKILHRTAVTNVMEVGSVVHDVPVMLSS
jgi:hypothetical protein